VSVCKPRALCAATDTATPTVYPPLHLSESMSTYQTEDIMKTETIQEFLARGGKITKVPTSSTPAKRKSVASKADVSKVDLAVIPESLKIALGLK